VAFIFSKTIVDPLLGNIMLDRRLPVWLARGGLLCVFSSPDRKTAPIGDQGRVGTSFLVTQNGSL
jgi:hypothetical protein